MTHSFNEADIKHFIKIDIPNSFQDATNYTCELFRLIRKADPSNKYKLKSVYPNEVEAWERYERIDLCRDWEQLPEVGSIVQIGRKVMGAEAGSLGVVYEQYAIGGRELTGVGIIFSNGDYDGFSREDLNLCKVSHTGRIDQMLKYYRFENVGQLIQDFKRGVFSRVFEAV